MEKFKNLQNKACLPSLLCFLMCPGYFGGDFLTFSLWDTLPPHRVVTKLDTPKSDYRKSTGTKWLVLGLGLGLGLGLMVSKPNPNPN